VRRMKWLIPALLVLAACGTDGEEFNDAPKLNNVDTGAVRISFPDGFSNVAAKCFGTDMVYSSTNSPSGSGRSMAVSSNHPWCADGILTEEEQKQ